MQPYTHDWYHDEGDWHGNFRDRFLYYGTGGLLDPKMPVEAYVFGRGSTQGITTRAGWSSLGFRGFALGASASLSLAVLGAGFVGAIFDPLSYNEGGVDDFIYPVFKKKQLDFDFRQPGRFS